MSNDPLDASTHRPHWRILYIEDNENDFYILRHMLTKLENVQYTIDWKSDGREGLKALSLGVYDVCIVDYRLGKDNGLDLLKSALAQAITVPMILLTAEGQQDVDNEAMQAGAADYLVKEQITPPLLERTIRHAKQRQDVIEALQESQRRLHTTLQALSARNNELEVQINERRQAEEALRRSEEELYQIRKMEAIGRLAGGVAHDFNNLMTGIMGIAEDLQSSFPSTDPRYEDLGEITKAGEKASSLIKQLLTFGGRQVVSAKILDINTTVRDMEKILRRLIREDIHMEISLTQDVGNICADLGHLEQILINLALNARDAMPQGGRLRIETLAAQIPPNHRLMSAPPPGDYVQLNVVDSGAGMDDQTLKHIFEPFFTTKPKDKGTGLGLATVYGIVHQHDGHVFVESAPGQGTAFRIYFPRVTEAATAKSISEKKPVGVTTGSETILVVEDEDIVRLVATRALRKAGYKVLEAPDGQAALKVLEQNQLIDIVLTDIIMPGINGRELAERARILKPDMVILYMSGYTEQIIEKRGILEPGIDFIPKTFSATTLCQKVREVLDRQRPSAKT